MNGGTTYEEQVEQNRQKSRELGCQVLRLKRQNEELLRALGSSRDQPGETGVVTPEAV